MLHLFRHIEFLLVHNDCVIVPGLGAFIASRLPARIDYETQKIIPPCRYVMFNQAVTLDDGLLANSFSRQLSLSFEESRQIISKEVGIIMEMLRIKKTLEFGHLGLFTLEEVNRIIFSPKMNSESLSQALGFSTVNYSLHSDNNLSPSLPYTPKEFKISGIRVKDRRKEWLKVAAALTLVVVVSLALFIFPHTKDLKEDRASVVPVEVILEKTSEKFDKPFKQTDDSSVKETERIGEITEETSIQPIFYLIVATFHSEKEADRYISAYSTPEFPLELVPSRKLTRVAVASSGNREEMFRKLNTSPIATRFPNAWVWTSSK